MILASKSYEMEDEESEDLDTVIERTTGINFRKVQEEQEKEIEEIDGRRERENREIMKFPKKIEQKENDYSLISVTGTSAMKTNNPTTIQPTPNMQESRQVQLKPLRGKIGVLSKENKPNVVKQQNQIPPANLSIMVLS